MDRDQAKELGGHLRQLRKQRGMSARDVGDLADVSDATVIRIENGAFANPHPETLARIARAIGADLTEIFTAAEYSMPTELPTLMPYLRAKYKDLPDEAVDQIQFYAQKLARKHGVDLGGPAPGQDETP